MRGKRVCFGLISVAAAAAGQNCYQFSGSGVTLQVTVQTITSSIGPTDGVALYNFNGTSTLTQGGVTQTAQIQFGTGSIEIQYIVAGGAASTNISFAMPNAGTNQTEGWGVLLAGLGNLLPGQTLPSALPPIAVWQGVGNSDTISVGTQSGTPAQYPVTAVSACGSTGGTPPPTTGATSPLADLGDPASIPGDCGCGEPINVGTGNVYYETTDYQTAGANQLKLTRYYNSLAAASGSTFATMLGPNWRTNYDRYLRLASSTSVIAERPNGQQATFTLNGSTWTTDTDIDLALTNSGSASGMNWTLTDHWDNVETYTSSGGNEAVLQTIRARNGYTQTLKYIGTNQLSVVTDSYNRSLVFLVSKGVLQSVTTPDGGVVTFSFTSGALTSVGYSTTPVTNVSYVYGNSSFPNAITGIVDEDGATYISWTYDSTGRALTGQFAGGAGLNTIVYNDTDGSRTVTNALGETDLYKFTTLQGIPKVTEVDRQASSTTVAATATYAYDSNGYTSSYTDFNGNLTNYVNDPHGQPTSIVEAAGSPAARATTVTYLSDFHLPSQIVTAGATTAYTYDANGEALTRTVTDTTANSLPYSTNGQSRTWTYTYGNSLLTSVKAPRTDVNNVTTFTYDSSGGLTSVTNALNQKFQITQHLQGGLPETIVDPNGVIVKLAYDGRQRLLSSAVTTSAGVLTTTYTYDPAGNLISVAQPDGSTISSTYDAAHRLTGFSDLFGQKISFTLDGLGDRTKIQWIDSNGVTQRTHSGVYDVLGRILQDLGGVNQSTSYTYDSDGNAVKAVDALNHVTQQSFDALNRLIANINPVNGKITAAYDAHNRPLGFTDSDGAGTGYAYDGWGDLIERVSPATGSTVVHYDGDGNATQKVDARGVVANYSYDALDRVIAITYPGDSAENITYTYDESGHGFGIGRLTSVKDAAGALSLTYDERGNEVTETRVSGSATLKTSYAYDKASRVIAITYPSGTSVTYSRDKMGRITQVSGQAAGSALQTIVSGITYEPFGPATGLKFGNGITETRNFDQDYRVIHLASSGNAAVQSLFYSYDATDNVTAITDGITSTNNQLISYDEVNEIQSATAGYGTLRFAYDANGNRVSESNPSASMDGLGTVTTFAYNQAGRLASATAGTQQLAQYTYDGFGQRLIKQTSASSTIYLYDRNRALLEEANGQGAALSDYIYLDGRPIALVTVANGSQVYFLHDDRLGTPQLATDKNQATAWIANYLPFGALDTKTSQTATLSQDLRLPGQVFDVETGLSQNGYRYYSPNTGRYSQSDPIGLAGGSNTYAYVGGNPLTFVDPLGLCRVETSFDITELIGEHGNFEIFPAQQWQALSPSAQQEEEDYVDQPLPDRDPGLIEEIFQTISGWIAKPEPEQGVTVGNGIRG